MKVGSQAELSLDTVITENHRCSQDVRVFFKTVIPKFHFSTYIQNYFKNNVGKTHRDAINAWFEEEERKTEQSQLLFGTAFIGLPLSECSTRGLPSIFSLTTVFFINSEPSEITEKVHIKKKIIRLPTICRQLDYFFCLC